MKYEVKPLGKILYYVGAVKLYHYGHISKDTGFANGVYRWYNPISWLMWILMVVPCAIIGERISEVVPFKLSDFYKEDAKWISWRDFK